MACEDGSCIMCKCSTGLGCKDPGEMAYQKSRKVREEDIMKAAERSSNIEGKSLKRALKNKEARKKIEAAGKKLKI